MTATKKLTIQLAAPSPGMTLENLHVQQAAGGIVIRATWRHPPACQLASAADDIDMASQTRGQAWLAQKISAWKAAC